MFGSFFIAIWYSLLCPHFLKKNIYRSEPVQHSEVPHPLIEVYDHSRISSKLLIFNNK